MAFEIAWFVLLVLVALAFMLGPVLARTLEKPGRTLSDRELLEREKRAALLLLRDLEFDYRSGKILEADYQSSRAEAERQALELLRRLDGLEEVHDAAR